MSSNPMRACADIFLAPHLALSSVQHKKGWAWLPFASILTMTLLVFVYYFSVVDIDWFQQQSLEQAAAMTGMSYQELKAAKPPSNASSIMLQTSISVAIGLVFVNLLSALYYSLATKITAKNDLSFKDWFAFTWWTSMPLILSASLSMLVIFFASDTQIAMNDLQPTSLNSLIFSLSESNVWYGFFEGITVFNFWTITLVCLGLKAWLHITTNKALILAVLPSIIIYGSWAAYIGFIA